MSTASGARAVAKEVGGLAIPCNIANEAEVNALVAQAQHELGPIDVFFNNAGRCDRRSAADDADRACGTHQWQINLMSHVYAVRAVLPGMLDRGAGYLLHTASMAGILTSARAI